MDCTIAELLRLVTIGSTSLRDGAKLGMDPRILKQQVLHERISTAQSTTRFPSIRIADGELSKDPCEHTGRHQGSTMRDRVVGARQYSPTLTHEAALGAEDGDSGDNHLKICDGPAGLSMLWLLRLLLPVEIALISCSKLR